MTRFRLVLPDLVLLLLCQSLFATTTYYVGSCHAGAYETINAAVAAAATGSSILICPGTYAEQIIISKQITLHGMSFNGASGAVVAVPAAGLSNESSLYFGQIAPQIEVLADGVTISNIAVDGTAGSSNCPSTWGYVGIMFAGGSSGTVNQVLVHNQNCTSDGYGFLAENGAGTKQTVLIEASSVRGISYAGIIGYSGETPSTLSANVENNDVSAGQWGILEAGTAGMVSQNRVGPTREGIYAYSALDTISGNTIVDSAEGVLVIQGQPTITGNTIVNATSDGIGANGGGQITSNHISNTPIGMSINSNTVTVQGNHITNASQFGISFQCQSPTVSGNFISDTPLGITNVLGSYTGTNTFLNVPTVRSTGSC
ncbi:MAG: right-handed parallel beta-helix repeat-containing protein [Candidatus Sulfotelmatobacter sp.]